MTRSRQGYFPLPEMAVLFFYGIARLLPTTLRDQLSFSTFETNPDRLGTLLAAMRFKLDKDGDGDVKPDMGSLTLSSVNFNRDASVNSPEMIQRLAAEMK